MNRLRRQHQARRTVGKIPLAVPSKTQTPKQTPRQHERDAAEKGPATASSTVQCADGTSEKIPVRHKVDIDDDLSPSNLRAEGADYQIAWEQPVVGDEPLVGRTFYISEDMGELWCREESLRSFSDQLTA